ERFAAGLADDQRRFGVDLLGGDSVATTGPAVLSLTALGDVAAGTEIRRSGAQVGDLVWISGSIGDAYLGLKVLQGGYPRLDPAESAKLIARFQLPEPRTGLGPKLIGVAHAMCDVSDGLIADLGNICDASAVAAVVELASVPLSTPALRLVEQEPDLPALLATSGDDYELLFSAPQAATVMIERLAAELNLPITPIGMIEPGAGVRLLASGQPVPIAAPGYRHF
ncbi:MAG TPA: AIR synthase-related protein, partial [Stellaceae bacterium]|nr:AIR synthase-related protein [Stellaceae bacterium]